MSKTLKKYILLLIVTLICIPFHIQAKTNDGSRYAANSVLSQGSWYKIKVQGTGIYKLTYDDLKKMGLSNPANVKIYGYGGWLLNEDFTMPYVDDLPQVSVWMSKEPSSFANGDYILFYAQGDIKWEYDKETKEFVHTQNPYSADSYYFVTESVGEFKPMQRKTSLSVATTTISSFDDYYLHEKELLNVGQTGREFYGESFTTTKSQNFSLPLDGATADTASIRYNFISRVSVSSGALNVSLNGALLKTNYTQVIPPSSFYYTHATTINDVVKTASLQNTNTLNLNYQVGNGSGTRLHLNYIRVNYKRMLKPYSGVTLFRSNHLSENVNFQIADASSSLLVFDVTDNANVSQMDTELLGTTLRFGAANSSIREYAMVDLTKTIPAPEVVGKVSNQNLHAQSSPDMVIIVQPLLKKYAEELAKLHEQDSGLKSLIVSPQDIYNEFSSGKPDITAYRRFLKMFYDRSSDTESKLKYLLLFGGGTYNNRLIGIDKTPQAKTMLLTYQSKESLLETLSYVSDDYLGFLDDSEGDKLGQAVLDIGVGRLPVKTEKEAADVVQKIKNYMMDVNKGVWQNNITFIADDLVAGSNSINTERQHILSGEELSGYMDKNHPEFIVNKIYQDAYGRVTEANGARYPDATKALLERINNGTLALNFIGHGSTRNWTHENLLTYANIEGMDNNRLPLWITATCDFSRFDSDETSGGELAVLNPSGGAIALFSTVRVVFISDNEVMNRNINKYLLQKEDGKPARLGDIIRKAKADMLGDNNKLRFLLLGDPALRLAYSEDTYNIEVTEMNGMDASSASLNIRALDDVVIKGRVVNQEGETVPHFNGILEAIIFDAQQDLKTRGNVQSGINEEYIVNYADYTNTLFASRVEIKEGEFQINFTAPKDILYKGNKAKMSFLGYDSQGKYKAQGLFQNYTVGGTNPGALEETNPPTIEKIYLNSESFQSGDNVNRTPLFYAEVSDDTGINLSSAIGHNITLILDGKTPYNLTPYFVNDNNNSKKGSVTFRLPELSLGSHSLLFRVWDVWNNSQTETINFTVTDDYSSSAYSFDIWGNPAKDLTRFVFKTDTPGTNVSIQIFVYTITGRLVWVQEERGAADSLGVYIREWNLNGDGGGRISPGVYVCTGMVNVDGKTIALKSKKLIVSDY
ncbi:MAG: type secretion system sortase PorU [Bacteroidota bacterium]|jgi:hypothetical protein